jgi:hypothetical protein
MHGSGLSSSVGWPSPASLIPHLVGGGPKLRFKVQRGAVRFFLIAALCHTLCGQNSAAGGLCKAEIDAHAYSLKKGQTANQRKFLSIKAKGGLGRALENVLTAKRSLFWGRLAEKRGAALLKYHFFLFSRRHQVLPGRHRWLEEFWLTSLSIFHYQFSIPPLHCLLVILNSELLI